MTPNRGRGESAWWLQALPKLLEELRASGTGLTHDEVRARLRHYGRNEFRGRPECAVWVEFLRRFRNPLVLILIAASIVSALAGERASFLIIVVMVLMSVTLDFVQEYHAGRAAQRLRQTVQARRRRAVCRFGCWGQVLFWFSHYIKEPAMLKVLLPVDGSDNAIRATQELIKTLDWYKDQPTVDLLTVHLPVHQFPNMSLVVSNEMLERYYAEESDDMLAASRKALDAAGVKYTAHKLVGPIAECIIDQAKQCGSSMIYMGTRGMTALANMVMGSVTTRVLHLAHIPVVLIH